MLTQQLPYDKYLEDGRHKGLLIKMWEQMTGEALPSIPPAVSYHFAKSPPSLEPWTFENFCCAPSFALSPKIQVEPWIAGKKMHC
jgi:hypothetical protein